MANGFAIIFLFFVVIVITAPLFVGWTIYSIVRAVVGGILHLMFGSSHHREQRAMPTNVVHCARSGCGAAESGGSALLPALRGRAAGAPARRRTKGGGMVSTATPAPPAGNLSEHDQLGIAVLRSLGRVHTKRFSVGPIRTFFGAWLTLGVLPFFGLSRRFRDYVSFERQQLVHLADWLRRHHDSPEAIGFQELTRRLRFRESLHIIGLLCVLAVIALLVVWTQPFSIQRLVDVTYHAPIANDAFIAWNVGLTIAYGLLVAQLLSHASAFRRCVAQFNKVTARLGLNPVELPHLSSRGGIVWLIAAIILIWFGAFWSIPMIIAGMIQRRQIDDAAANARREIADRMRLLLTQRRSDAAKSSGPDYRIHGARCARLLCQAPLASDAAYCPRCGAPVYTS